jgi:hypothetical protein
MAAAVEDAADDVAGCGVMAQRAYPLPPAWPSPRRSWRWSFWYGGRTRRLLAVLTPALHPLVHLLEREAPRGDDEGEEQPK